MALPSTLIAQQSKGLISATQEMWKSIKIEQYGETNLLPENENLYTFESQNDTVSVLVGVLLRNGDYSKFYKNKETETLNKKLWMFIPNEVNDTFNKKDLEKNSKRLQQFLGLDTIERRDTIVVLRIKLGNLYRPAYVIDPCQKVSEPTRIMTFSDKEFKDWFYDNLLTNTYPWTRMGYTYDWGENNEKHIGATEFVCKKNSEVNIIGFCTVGSFLIQQGNIQDILSK